MAQKAQFNQLRFSSALRQRGRRTAAVVFDPNTQAIQSGWFDGVFATDLFSFLDWLRTADGGLLHTQAWLFRHHLPTLIAAFKPPEVHRRCD